MESLQKPISDIVTELNIPVYFVMGKYDCMTSPEAAAEYLHRLSGQTSDAMILFEESAHYPHLEEKEKFAEWMSSTFLSGSENSAIEK